jgi:hypothetical protein
MVSLSHFDSGPACHAAHATERAEWSHVKAAEDIIEEPVHLAMQRHERITFLAIAARGLLIATPRDEIAHVHRTTSFNIMKPSAGVRHQPPAGAEDFLMA